MEKKLQGLGSLSLFVCCFRRRAPKTACLAGLALLLGLSGCESKRRPGTGGSAPAGLSAPSVSPVPNPKEAPEAPESFTKTAKEPTPSPAEDEALQPVAQQGLSERWTIGAVADVGPAAPMTAAAQGVVLISKDNRIHLARRKKDQFVSVDLPPDAVSRYGRGPALTSEHVYWVSPEGALLEGALNSETVRELDRDVRFGARVSALSVQDRDLVAYIKGNEELTTAHLWASGYGNAKGERKSLSPEGSSATSVTLVAEQPHPRVVVLEGRSGMSPVHSRLVHVTHRRITLELDQIVWVGPGSHSLTEIVSLEQPKGGTTTLLASARDITHFGLAQLPIRPDSNEISPIWRPYPNGLDPAPVAASRLCGADYALFAIPSHERPRAPQELRIARLTAQGLQEEEILARSRAFNDISVAPLKRGAILAWTADRRTWALVLGCPE